MIWRNQNDGPEGRDLGEPRDEPGQAPLDAGSSNGPMSSVGQRVETVLQAAERAAADIRKDAERWAQRHMEDTRRRADELAARQVQELSSITDDLLARAHAVARQSDELISALDSASRRALRVSPRRHDDNGSGRLDGDVHSHEARNGVAPSDPRPNVGHREQRPAGSVSDGARLLATQMSVAGSNREKIASRLREEFGIEDSSAILDEAGI
jgi:hypothetical protein